MAASPRQQATGDGGRGFFASLGMTGSEPVAAVAAHSVRHAVLRSDEVTGILRDSEEFRDQGETPQGEALAALSPRPLSNTTRGEYNGLFSEL